MAPEIQPVDEAKVNDLLRYASAVVTLGVDPDNPDRAKVDIVQLGHRRPICLNVQAVMLIDLAQNLAEAHGEGRC
jgi:hypothetical protein